MKKRSKRYHQGKKLYTEEQVYPLKEAVQILKKMPPAKFDETVELSLKLGVDSRHSDQMVRGTVLLPHGSGKTKRVLVFAKGEKMKEAKDAGADYVGDDELILKIQGGWFDFDAVIATPDMMKDIAKLGRVLGTKGLMPNPKTGTVTVDVAKAIKEVKAGKLDFRVDKSNDIHVPIGKLSFSAEKIFENAEAVIDAINKAKPAAAKGQFVRKMSIASTMSCGIKLAV